MSINTESSSDFAGVVILEELTEYVTGMNVVDIGLSGEIKIMLSHPLDLHDNSRILEGQN